MTTDRVEELREALHAGWYPEVRYLARPVLEEAQARNDELGHAVAERMRQVIAYAEHHLLVYAEDMAETPFTPSADIHRHTRAHRAYLTSVAAARRVGRHRSYSTHPSNPVAVAVAGVDRVEHDRAVMHAEKCWDLWYLAAYLCETATPDADPFSVRTVADLQRLAALVESLSSCRRHVHRRRRRTRSQHPPGRTALAFRMSAQAPPLTPMANAARRNRTTSPPPT